MSSIERPSLRKALAIALTGSLLALAPWMADAQLAPVAGAHYDGIAGTGFQGGASAGGAYTTALPLELPPARGGLPLPLQVIYSGARTVGAAGLGWEVPVSFVLRSTSTARRRPATQAFSLDNPPPLVAPERWSINLLGTSVDLVRNAANTAWVGRRGNTQLEVRSAGEGLLTAYDGSGRTYQFSARGATAGSRLMDGNLYLLTSISGPDGNQVQLNYAIAAPALPGGGNGLSINVSTLAYNSQPGSPNCFKHRVFLSYDAAAAAPLSLSVMDSNTVWARTQKLTAITIKSKDSCSSSETTLGTYALSYQPDTDTRLPRLQSVTRSGRQGTPEHSVNLPVASYTYGAVVDAANNRITFQKVQDAGPPAGPEHYSAGLSFTKKVSSGPSNPNATSDLETQQVLMDFNGDGRLDFSNRERQIFYSTANAAGPTQFVAGTATLPAYARVRALGLDPSANRYQGNRQNETYVQHIDMNGDGRIDVVDADADAANWLVYFNVPDAAAAGGATFTAPRKIPTARLRAALGAIGLNFDRVPLARKVTVPERPYVTCWINRVIQGQLIWMAATRNDEANCTGAPPENLRKRTITEFELKDVNGDGYPDFVYNGSRVFVDTHDSPPQPDFPPPPESPSVFVATTLTSDLSGSRDVKALMNTAGVRIADTEEVFSSTVTLEAGGSNGCGVGRWESLAPASQERLGRVLGETCGLQDVNGDGLVDRVSTTAGQTSARLGTGDTRHAFMDNVTIAMPGPLTQSFTDRGPTPGSSAPRGCIDLLTYNSIIQSQLRDMNGDGLPDYLRETRDGVFDVALGTGTGFTAPVAISITGGSPAHLSVERNQCHVPDTAGTHLASGATTGFYDLDGDGQAEWVSSGTTSNGAPTWNVFQLKPPVAQVDTGGGIAGVPAAGRLVRIDSGYGASTTIGYRSAKEEWNSAHSVPFPEIVVESVGTKNAANASLLSTTRYAYRGAQMMFDPVHDSFRFAGYRRTVSLQNASDAATAEGIATVTDTYGLEPFEPGSGHQARLLRLLKAGLVSDVTTLQVGGSNANNPWDVLNADINNDPRRIGGSHHDWDARLLPDAAVYAGNERCIDLMYPYDLLASRNNAVSPTDDVCARRGFVFEANVFQWSGTPGTSPALTSAQTVQTNTQVTAVDDFERVTAVTHDNDFTRGEDDICSETVYAVPMGSAARVLTAPASVTTTNCGDSPQTRKLLSQTTFEYDTSASGVKLPAGRIDKGFLTAQLVARLDPASGTPVDPSNPQIRRFDAVYDSASGNPVRHTVTRDDGATAVTTTGYDSFGLAVISSQTRATNADGSSIPALNTSAVIDGVSLDLLSSTDANGSRRGIVYDGFGRVRISTFTPPGGSEGALSTTRYLGFASGESGGRRIESTVFTNPVPLASLASASGRSGTTVLDSLGRIVQNDLKLGADYGQQTLVVGRRVYDQLGRVQFEADPHPASQPFGAAYGTSFHASMSGRSQVTVRGHGQQPMLPLQSDEGSERYVWTQETRFADHRSIVRSLDAAALTGGSPQQDTARETASSAIGQVLTERTIAAGLVQERMDFGYDALGNMARLTRYHDPQGASGAVLTQWHYDSLGRVLELREPDAATQYRSYDSWGAMTALQWCDPQVSACSAPATFNRGSYSRYDALGRLVHSEDRSNNSVIAASVRDFVYDQGVPTTTPPLTPANVLGRLAKATAATSSVSFSYDDWGRADTQVHIDRTLAPNGVYVQKTQYNGDGSLRSLHLQLPDAAYADEKVDYGYDSAGRTRSARFSDGSSSKDLFTSGSNGRDVYGRLRQAQFGLNSYTADYADSGRRLLRSAKVATPPLLPPASREIVFTAASSGLPAFDALGRERSRREIRDGSASAPTIESSYDALGRLQQSRRQVSGSGVTERRFGYDALGNLLNQTHLSGSGPASTTLSYQSTDRDRLCSVAFGTATPSPACTVKYDGVGNIVEMPTRDGVLRQLSYFPSGATRSVVMGSTSATYDYDAFGGVQRLVLATSGADARNDKHFGSLITQRNETVNGAPSAVLTRRFPGPMGFVATRHGPGASATWTFAFGEQRGNRYVTDQNGAFVQDLDYQPYGETLPQAGGALPGSPQYLSEQWNQGDALSALGVSQLGARLYDPVIGRFLSRDPLLIPRSAATTNPYAFAANDPVNRSDPSGLDSELSIYRRYSNESGGGFGFGWSVSFSGIGSAIGNAASALGNAIAGVFSGWTAGGGPILPRAAASTVSLSQLANATRPASPSSSGGSAGSGGTSGFVKGSINPAAFGPTGFKGAPIDTRELFTSQTITRTEQRYVNRFFVPFTVVKYNFADETANIINALLKEGYGVDLDIRDVNIYQDPDGSDTKLADLDGTWGSYTMTLYVDWETFTGWEPASQLQLIAHEMTHYAQFKDLSWYVPNAGLKWVYTSEHRQGESSYSIPDELANRQFRGMTLRNEKYTYDQEAERTGLEIVRRYRSK